MNKIKILLVVLMVASIFILPRLLAGGSNLIKNLPSRATDVKSSLSLPQSLTIPSNSNFNLPVFIDVNTALNKQVQLILNFDRQMLTLTDITLKNPFDKTPVIREANHSGLIKFEADIPSSTGRVVLATLTFSPKQLGQTKVTLDNINSEITITSPTSTSTQISSQNNDLTDLNKDGKIDIYDRNLLLQKIGQSK